jgi:O-antigen ligase
MSINYDKSANQITSMLKAIFSWFGLLSAVVASLSIVANDIYYLPGSSPTINTCYLLIGGLLAIFPFIEGQKRLAGLIFFIPLSAGMHQQINAIFDTSLSAFTNTGLDLVAGFFVVYLFKELIARAGRLKSFVMPWPLGLLLFFIFLSTALAITRNIRQSATETSIYGLVFNLVHFRPIGWHDDYMPIADWIAYGCAGALIILVLEVLRGAENKNEVVFRPLMAGLVVAFMLGALQASTGFGLSEPMLAFRKDHLGFAAIGFQPDIHAFAGHMLLGAVGLWAYFRICCSRMERSLVLVAIAFSWFGLVISKSRASLLIAIIATVVIALIYIWNKNRKWFYGVCICSAFAISTFTFFLVLNAESPIQSLTNQSPANWWSVIGGASGSRFEIWSGAFNMIKAFPLVGVGQGNFYHLSAEITFSKSHFLALNGGENAHNYFFQTFAELGLVGIFLFVMVFILPMMNARDRNIFIPSALGIIALFLGNIYAHSFLVRENLLVCATLLGLLYALSWPDPSNWTLKSNLLIVRYKKSQILSLVVCLLLAGASLYEVYQSFYTKIFDIGINCFQLRPLTVDGWTSGLYEIEVPPASKSFVISGQRPQTARYPKEIRIRFDEVNNNHTNALSNANIIMQEGKEQALIFKFNQPIENFPYSRKVIMRTENCFTPRNFGMNTDGRILGIQINEKILY